MVTFASVELHGLDMFGVTVEKNWIPHGIFHCSSDQCIKYSDIVYFISDLFQVCVCNE